MGASLAAEIGTMKVGEELMALDASALDPVRFLAVPRLLAVLVMVPAATLFGIIFGIYGGYIVCVGVLGQNATMFWDQMIEPMDKVDIRLGMTKSLIFASGNCAISFSINSALRNTNSWRTVELRTVTSSTPRRVGPGRLCSLSGGPTASRQVSASTAEPFRRA